MTLKYGSLFSGVGGFDLGFDQENYECVFQVEWDKHCQQILAKHWPEVPKWLDVQEVNGAEIPPCDVLTFGSPCQDLSVAGNQTGLNGDRSVMFYEATRIIQEMRNATKSVYPRVVVWENVPGALTSNNGQDFGQVLDTLANIGAVDIQWTVLDAAMFGSPQQRRRIFVVAVFDPRAASKCSETLLPVAQGSRRDFKKSRTASKNFATDVTRSFATNNSETIEPILDDHNGIENKVFGEGSFAQFVEDKFSTLKRVGGALGGGSENLIVQKTFPNHLTTRRFSPLECERLMGWPDNHTKWTADGKEQAETHRYKQCGNGVVTPVARFVAKNIKRIL